MGYTHYWRRKKELPELEFRASVGDFKLLLPHFGGLGVKLAGWDGRGAPEMSLDALAFNGVENCGHAEQDLGITWPADEAGGVAPGAGGKAQAGVWFAGARLQTRTCGGDCSHESFRLERVFKARFYGEAIPEEALHFAFCKTAYKPYDLAVTAALVIFSHHLANMKKDGPLITVSSDGEGKDWFDAKLLCKTVLGYGMDFSLRRTE